MAGGAPSSFQGSTGNYEDKNYTGPLVILTSLFFMWGFITCMNDILIPKLKGVFDLNYTQAMLIQFCFFGAYFIISLFYYLVSKFGEDPILKIGYKNAIVIGLIVAGIGCALFYPAAALHSYGFFLGALFVLASGVTILQIGANPYVALLGPPESSSSRLNLTQALNSFGTFVAPLFGSYVILDQVTTDLNNADSVKGPYVGLAITLLALAIIFKLINLPKVIGTDFDETIKEDESAGLGALKYGHLVLGVVGIFMYVGGEVSIGSFIVNFLGLENIGGYTEEQAAVYLSVYWGGAMIGRFLAAIFLSGKKLGGPQWLSIFIIFVFSYLIATFLINKEAITGALFDGVALNGSALDYNTPMIFTGITLANIFAFLIGKNNPAKTLGVFSGAVIIALFFVSFASGSLAMWAVLCIGLFNSIMFPTIFTLAIKGLGKDTSQGSSLLIMAVVGGALYPVLQGFVADITKNVQISFLIPLLAYAYIMYYGFVGSKPKKDGKPLDV